MRPNEACFRWIGLVALLVLTLPAPGQEAPELSAEKRASLIAQRDALAQQAIAKAKQGEFEDAQKLFDQVFEIETSIFGETHPELLGTLGYLARYAKAAKDWSGAIQYRRRACEMGQDLYPAGNYRVRDLELAVEDARDSRDRTDEQRKQLAEAETLNSQVVLAHRNGESSKAIDLAKRVVKLRRDLLGEEHHLYGESLNNLAIVYQSMGAYEKAEALFIESKSIDEKVFGKQHPAYAASLNNLGALYRLMDDYERAVPLYLEAKIIKEQTLGNQHLGYATSLNNLATLYHSMGYYDRAEPLFIEAKTIHGKVLGKSHHSYAVSVNNLANFYQVIGDYHRAEALYLEAIQIKEKEFGKQHPSYALSLDSLASLYVLKADYAQAEKLFFEANTILEKTLGKENPEYATNLNNLARLYWSMGDYAQAESRFTEAIAICEKSIGKDHSLYAVGLDNLANLYLSKGELARAESLCREALTIRGKVLGKEHPEYATSLNNLGGLYLLMGDHARAESLCVEAKTIRGEVFGRKHPEYASSLNNLARLYVAMGDHARAELLCVEAKTIRGEVLGKEHPEYADSLHSLARLYSSKGAYARAEPLYCEAIDITLAHLNETVYMQSERQQLLINQAVRHQLDDYLGCCIEGELDPRHVIEQIVRWKGAIFRRGRYTRLAAGDPALAVWFRQLQSLASQQSFLFRSVPAPNKIGVWKKRMASLTEKKRKLEAELSRRSVAFRDTVKLIRLEEVRQAIPSDAVLIDFLEYTENENRSLAASVIRREGELLLIDLGPAENVRQAIDTWRKSYGSAIEANEAGAELRRQLWEPLTGSLSGAELILVSTDGALGRLPLAALPGAKPNTYLIEDHRLALIPVPQLLPDLIRKQESRQLDRQLLVMGDVDYGESEAATVWQHLAETGPEIDLIKNLFTQTTKATEDMVTELRADQATESEFRAAAPNCQVLHLATHGFFEAADKENALSPHVVAASRGTLRPLAPKFASDHTIVTGFSPGQLSGLVFANANCTTKSVYHFSDGEFHDDGIMTADEIAYLPLDGCELAVLSACETGLGEVAGGEGLIGIQRAFQIAGARSTIATLWDVDDAVTRRMMQEFYTNYLGKGMSALDALRDAQLWALKNPREALGGSGSADVPRGVLKVVNEGDTAHRQRLSPFHWAPFVLSGDWR